MRIGRQSSFVEDDFGGHDAGAGAKVVGKAAGQAEAQQAATSRRNGMFQLGGQLCPIPAANHPDVRARRDTGLKSQADDDNKRLPVNVHGYIPNRTDKRLARRRFR
jgi:hypothetical protein